MFPRSAICALLSCVARKCSSPSQCVLVTRAASNDLNSGFHGNISRISRSRIARQKKSLLVAIFHAHGAGVDRVAHVVRLLNVGISVYLREVTSGANLGDLFLPARADDLFDVLTSPLVR